MTAQKSIKALLKHPSSHIKFPDDNEMAEYARLISLKEPAVSNIIGFIDGVSTPVQCSDDVEMSFSRMNVVMRDV
jgi:hypothetical protein